MDFAVLSPDFAIFSYLAIDFVTVSISASISSKDIVSISSIGSILPDTCTIFSSLKHLTTCAIASVSLICDRNLFPSPSPLEAPFTNPAISTNSIVA